MAQLTIQDFKDLHLILNKILNSEVTLNELYSKKNYENPSQITEQFVFQLKNMRDATCVMMETNTTLPTGLPKSTPSVPVISTPEGHIFTDINLKNIMFGIADDTIDEFVQEKALAIITAAYNAVDSIESHPNIWADEHTMPLIQSVIDLYPETKHWINSEIPLKIQNSPIKEEDETITSWNDNWNDSWQASDLL